MTQEEIAKVKAMTREQRLAHFVPLRLSKRISKKQYDFILGTPYEVVRMETPVLPQENGDTLEPQQEAPRKDVQHAREAISPPEEDWVSALARQFGGTVLPDTPTGKQGRLDEKSEQIKRNIASG